MPVSRKFSHTLALLAIGFATTVDAAPNSLIEAVANGDLSQSSAYEQAKSDVHFATLDLQRAERLYAAKLATNEQLAAARKALDDARIQLDALAKRQGQSPKP